MSTSPKIQRVLVLPDQHVRSEKGRIAGIDLRTHKALTSYMKDHKWSEVIMLGDFMDFNCISAHNANNLRAVEGTRIQADYVAGNKILDEYQQAAKGAKFVYIEGNHEERVERYINVHPELEGHIEVPQALNLKKRGVLWVPYASEGRVYNKGKATFGHGIYTGTYHARQHVEAYGTNFFYGHLHDIQTYSKVLVGDGSTLVGMSLGCLCDYRQYYMKGRPNRWQQAFSVFHFFPDGYFNFFVVMIFKHRFVSPEGVIYAG